MLTNFIVVVILNLYTYQITMLQTQVNTMLYVNYISLKKKNNWEICLTWNWNLGKLGNLPWHKTNKTDR